MASGYGEPLLMPVVVQIDAYDPVLPGTVTLRMASDDSDLVCHLNGQTWWPVLDRLPLLAMDFFGGEFGQVTTAAASMSLSVEPWPDFARYAFPDARLQLWHGDYGAAWASYTLRFDGRVTSQPVIEDGRAQIGFAVDDKWLDTPLLSTYAGTGGLEGQSEMKGATKPLAIGAPMGVPGVMLDPIKSIIQLSAYGAIESVDVPLERLARQFGSPLADYASYAELEAATLPAGQWATCKAAGLVRMGAPPYGKLCFLMKGDKGGVDGWVRRPGAIIKRLASIAGGASKVSETAVDALDTARPYDISLYYDGQISARQAIQDVAASVNAVAGVSLTGQLITVPVQINATGLTYRADGSTVPMLSSVRSLGISAPWWRLAIGAQPFWDVHGQGDYVQLPTVSSQYPQAAPSDVSIGHIWIDRTGRKWRYSGNLITLDGEPITIYGFPLVGTGYVDAQDQAGPNAASAAERALSVLECPASLTLYAAAGGAILSGQLPKPIPARRIQDGVDVSGQSQWSVSDLVGVVAGTITINGFGVIELPANFAIAREASFRVNSVHLGLLRSQVISITRLDAGATNTGTGGTSVNDNSLLPVSTNSMVAVSDILKVRTGSVGKINFTASVITTVDPDYPEGSFGAALIARYRPIAGAFSDVGTEATGIEATSYLELYQSTYGQINNRGEYNEFSQYFDTNGAIDLASEKTGLTANADYEVQLFARRTTSAPVKTVSLIGTFIATGS